MWLLLVTLFPICVLQLEPHWEPYWVSVCSVSLQEMNRFRTWCATLFGYDWVGIPLVYTQVCRMKTDVAHLIQSVFILSVTKSGSKCTKRASLSAKLGSYSTKLPMWLGFHGDDVMSRVPKHAVWENTVWECFTDFPLMLSSTYVNRKFNLVYFLLF